MSDTFSKVEVITGVARRRRFTTEQKLAVVAETMQPGMSISYVARRHGLSPSLVFLEAADERRGQGGGTRRR
jgi:transposase